MANNSILIHYSQCVCILIQQSIPIHQYCSLSALHLHTNTHTRTHTYTDACTHRHTHRDTNTYTQTHTHTNRYTFHPHYCLHRSTMVVTQAHYTIQIGPLQINKTQVPTLIIKACQCHHFILCYPAVLRYQSCWPRLERKENPPLPS